LVRYSINEEFKYVYANLKLVQNLLEFNCNFGRSYSKRYKTKTTVAASNCSTKSY
jgi:hypothetical protein